jgi:hypothetical protein
VLTDANGQARTTLTTTQETTVTASAAGVLTEPLTITREGILSASIGATSETAVAGVGQRWTFTANLSPDPPPTQPTSYEWHFGDGTNITTSGNSIAHVYGPAASGSARTVSVTISLANGQTVTASTEVLVATF